MINPGTGAVVVDFESGQPVKDPATIQEWASGIRERTAKAPVPGEIKSPDSIIADLENLKYLAAQNVMILREADRTRRAARRMLSRARLTALKKATGKDAETRRLESDVAAEAEVEICDNAEIAYEYAKGIADAVRTNTSAVQTQAKQVEITYQLAGRGH
jgi:hypothetical protein